MVHDLFSAVLDAAGQDCARTVILRLVKISDAGDDTRRPVDREELLSDSRDPADTRKVLDAYTRCRLLTQSRDTVEITHEALIRAWPRLRHWIDEDRAGNLIRQDVEEAAAAWNRDRRDAGRLHRGSRLDAARRWAASLGHDLSPAGAAFLAASVGYERRAAKLRRAAVTALAVSLAIALGLAGFAFVQQRTAISERDQAIRERDQATFNQTAAEGLQLAGSDTSLAAELDLAAYRMQQTPTLASRLLSLENTPLATAIPVGHGPVRALAASPDSHTLAVGSYDGTIELWDVADAAKPHMESTLHYFTSSITSLAFSAKGSILAAGSYSGVVVLWNVTDITHPQQLNYPTSSPDGYVGQIVFSPVGHNLAILYSGSVDLIDIADPTHPQLIGRPLSGSQQGIGYIAFSADGRTLAAADNDKTLWLWDLTNPAASHHFGQPQPATEANNIGAIAYSPGGRTLAVGGNNGRIQLWDIVGPARPRLLDVTLTGGTDPVFGLQFSQDGQILASADQDGTIRLWDMNDPAQPEPLGPAVSGGSGGIQAAALSPDGHLLASSSVTGTVQVWSLPQTMLPAPAPVNSVALSRHGHVLATGNSNGTIRLWDVTSYTHPSPLGQPIAADIGAVWAVAFSPDGRTMASAGDNGQIRLWDVTDPAHPQPVGRPLSAGTGQIWSVAFSPVGHTLASASADGTVLLWNVADPALPRPVGPPLAIRIANPNSISFSSDATMLTFGGWGTQSARNTGVVELWDIADITRPRLLKDITTETDLARATAFSPDKRILISGNYDGTVGYWVDLHAPVQPLAPQIGGIYAVTFSPDSKELAIGGATGLELWDTSSPSRPQPTGQSLTGYNSWITSLTFSPDGSTLISGSEDDTVRLWNLNVNDAIARICSTTGNVLTPKQWRTYIPNLPYHPPCHN